MSQLLPPIGINTVKFDRDGRASERDPDEPLRFHFRYRGMTFHVAIEAMEDSSTRMQLTGILGAVPYSIESRSLRKQTLQLIEAANAASPNSIKISRNKTVIFRKESFMGTPPKPNAVVEAATQMILRARPTILLFHFVLSAPRDSVFRLH